MEIAAQLATEIFSLINSAQKILIISHRNPDADTIGSNIALRVFLESIGKVVTSACIDPPPDNCLFIPKTETFINSFNYLDYDLIITVDAGSKAQTFFLDKYPEIIQSATESNPSDKENRSPKIINIDHHPSNERYGTTNLVVDTSASATLIIFNLFIIWQVQITPLIATCLLIGLYFDTGSFMHSNTNEEALNAAAELVSLGADQKSIVKNLFKTKSIEQLKIWGKILNQIRMTDNDVVVSAVLQKDLDECNATTNEVSGIIDYLNMAKGNKYATIITEDKGQIRGSFRTRRNDVNLSELACKLGGGGHKKASGFTIKGTLKKETYWSITNK